MDTSNLRPFRYRSTQTLFAALAIAATAIATAGASEVPALLDDFSNADATNLGTPRVIVDDSATGGRSRITQRFEKGILYAKGEIIPARGQPGWVSTGLLLSADGSPVDLSKYQGIRLKVRISAGLLSVSANSVEIDNYDYHAALVQPNSNEDIREIRVPFKDLKRAWSQQTRLNPATVNSISLVAIGMQKGPFAYEIDEIGFY